MNKFIMNGFRFPTILEHFLVYTHLQQKSCEGCGDYRGREVYMRIMGDEVAYLCDDCCGPYYYEL